MIDYSLDLGLGTDISRAAVRAIYDALGVSPLAGQAFAGWKTLLSQAMGQDLNRPAAALEDLCGAYEIEAGDAFRARPAAILFALHTYHAILTKLIVCHALRFVPGPAEMSRGGDGGDSLSAMMREMENGRIVSTLWPQDEYVQTGENGDGEQAGRDWFAWYLDVLSRPMRKWISRAAEVIAKYDVAGPVGGDRLGELYQSLLPKKVRHALGEYYTPAWLVEYMLDRLKYRGGLDETILDPSCGSGNFLLAAIGRIRRRWETKIPPQELARKICENVAGFDLNPIAVLTARANFLLAVGDLIDNPGATGCSSGSAEPSSSGVTGNSPGATGCLPASAESHLQKMPIQLRDTILAADESPRRFDYVAGNPPWIAWDNLSNAYREKTKPIWRRLGLFTLSGNDARHGGGKKDLSMLMTYVCAERHLADGGRLGFVVTQTLFQTRGAGDGFRRFRIGDGGPPLGVYHADDMVALRPFPGAANWTGTIFLKKGCETVYPVAYDRWQQAKKTLPDKPAAAHDKFERERLQARPVDRDRPGSPWFVQPADIEADLTLLVRPSDYTGHLGANTGGANPVYWLRIIANEGGYLRVANLAQSGARGSKIAAVEAAIEPELVYPLVRWGDVARYRAAPSAYILMAQDPLSRRGYDENYMRERFPKTYAYLAGHKERLEARAAYRRYQADAAFYSMYNVGEYTLAPIKVVWRRMDKRINAAVLEPVDDRFLGYRPVVPQETCVLIAAASRDEAHYLAAVLNSRRTELLACGHSVTGGKGFGSPGILDYLGIERFRPEDARHLELARLSRLAHDLSAAGEDLAAVQADIDRTARVDSSDRPG